MNENEHLDGAEAELLQRMQSADPARTSPMVDSWMPDLVDATMSNTHVAPKSSSRRWAPAVAAAVTLTVVGGVGSTFLGGTHPARAPDPTVTTLTLPGGSGTSMSSCVVFDVRYLRDMPVAFSGRATEIRNDGVTLKVDRWYKGGNADVVRLANYDEGTVSLDGFTFEQGDRYLITATQRTVNFCGFSGPWNQELADAFDEAFRS